MKTPLVSFLAAALCMPAAVALAQHRSARPAVAPAKVSTPRSVGVHMTAHPEQPVHPQKNPPHEVIVHDPKTNKDEHHVVVVDHRPAHVIDRDPHLRVITRTSFHPAHDWNRFHIAHGGWFHLWGIAAWNDVGTVSCEAVNESTGALYPVSEDRDARGWDDDGVNSILDAALDDCYAEANGATCGPATPACSFQPW